MIIPKQFKPEKKILFFPIFKTAITAMLLFGCYSIITNNQLGTGTLIISEGILIAMSPFFIFGDGIKTLSNSVGYLYGSKVLLPTEITEKIEVKDKRNKTKIKSRRIKAPDRKTETIMKVYNYEYIKNDDLYGMYYLKKKESENYTVFLEISIDTLPWFLSEENWELRTSEFEHFISICNFKLFNISSNVNFSQIKEDIDYIEMRESNESYKTFLESKKQQLQQASKYKENKFYIQFETKSEKEIEELIVLLNQTHIQLTVVDELPIFEKILSERITSMADSTIKEDCIIKNSSEKKYVKYLRVKNFETEISPRFLSTVFDSEYSGCINLKVIKDPTAICRKALSEMNSRQSTNQMQDIENGKSLDELVGIVEAIRDSSMKLYEIEVLVKFEEDSYEDIQRTEKLFLKSIAVTSSFKFDTCKFTQQENFKLFKDNITTGDLMVQSPAIAIGYPINYTGLIQENGLLKGFSGNSIVVLDTTRIDNETNQASYDMIVVGEKGSGKSSALKEQAMEDILLKNGRVIVFDFDQETARMCKKLDGNIYTLGVENINLLQPDVAFNENLVLTQNAHIESVITFLELIYPSNFSSILMMKEILREYYSHCNKNSEIPTMENLKIFVDSTTTKREMNPELENTLAVINDFLYQYPYFSKESSDFKYSSKYISFDFSQVKDNESLMNACLYWIIKKCNYSMRNNKFYSAKERYGTVKYYKYVNSYLEFNGISEPDNLEDLDEIEIIEYIEHNQILLRIIIDEAHRAFDVEQSKLFVLKMFKEARKYRTGITIADHTVSNLADKNDKKLHEIWTLSNYKLMLKLGKEETRKLVELDEINEIEAYNLMNPSEKGAGMILVGNMRFSYNSPLSKELCFDFDGGK